MGILTKEVQVLASGKNIKYYRDRGYDAKWRELLTVKVEDLPLRSDVLIETECDYCGEKKAPIKYSDYNTATKNGTIKCCCSKCAYLKREETMVAKYGHAYAMQNPEMKAKIQETNMKRYGSVSPSGNKQVREKQKQTLFQNYGVEYPSQSKEIMDKVKKTNLERYGVTNPLFNVDIQEKIKKTNLERYGVENALLNKNIRDKRDSIMLEKYGTLSPLQNKECLDKMKQTNLNKYGVENVSQIDNIKQKKKSTTFEHFGVENPSESEIVQEKMRQTNLEKYGVEYFVLHPEFQEYLKNINMERYGVPHHLQNPDILRKQKETFYKNHTCPTSNQQLYLFNLYSQNSCVALNYPIAYYSADLCFLEEKLIIEYDGGGHNLGVTLGSFTPEEFKRKEIIRNSVIKREGYKQMRIISSKDYLPSDEILLQMLEHTRKYFSDYPEHSWIEFNIDTSTVRNAEQKDGVFFDFGKLRKIKKAEITTQSEQLGA